MTSATLGACAAMLPLQSEASVLCADASAERLALLTQRLGREGVHVVCTRSAGECLAMTARYRPMLVILDGEFLQVDQENIPEYISRISASTAVFVTVDDPSHLEDTRPAFVEAVLQRGDVESVVSRLRQLR